MAIIGVAVIAALAAIEIAHVLAGREEVEGMSIIKRPFAGFRKLKRRYKVGILSAGGLAVFASAALAFYLLSLSGSGQGSVGINGATTHDLGAASLRVVIKGQDNGKLDVGQAAPAGIWLAQGATPLANSQYQIAGVDTQALQVTGAQGACDPAWFTVSSWTPNPLWATNGNANAGAGSGTQWPEDINVSEAGTGNPGVNGVLTSGLLFPDGTTNPNGAVSLADSALDPTVAPAAGAKNINGLPDPSSDFEIATANVTFTNQNVDQNACDGATLTIPVSLSAG